jgi:hypothetical protein
MNIWALKKDISIKSMLLLFEQKHGLDNLHFKQNDSLDYRSIRINDNQTEGLNAYIYSYGQSADYYGIQLEYPKTEMSQDYLMDTYENLPIDRLFDLICLHFNRIS